MKPSERIKYIAMDNVYKKRFERTFFPCSNEDVPLFISSIMDYLDEQFELQVPTTTMKKPAKKVNKLKTAKTAVAKKAIKKAKKK